MEAKEPDKIYIGLDMIFASWIDDQPNLADEGVILEEPVYLDEIKKNK